MSEKNFVVYKSSAGSGKTFTLVKEYLKLVFKNTDALYFKKVLAITFTNKASAEMKERILKYLRAFSDRKLDKSTEGMMLVLCKELNLNQNEIFAKAEDVFKLMLHNYSEINISTIDKFNYKIIRTFAHDLQLPLNFELLLDSEILLSQAVNELINKAGEDEQLTRFLIEYAEYNIEENKSKNIEGDIQALASQLLKEDALKHLSALKDYTLDDFSEIKASIRKHQSEFENSIIIIAKKAWDLIISNGLTNKAFFQGNSGIGKFFEKNANHDFTFTLNSYQEKAFSEDKWYTKSGSSDSNAIDGIKGMLTDYYLQLENIFSKSLNDYKLLSLIEKNFYPLALLNELAKIIENIKSENNLVHISELNKKISEAIVNEPAPFIYERIGEKYKHFLIDEFQDTSSMQFQNLLPLIDNALAEANFTMLVGDAKQSIYRWRGGDASQFVNLPMIADAFSNISADLYQPSLMRNFREEQLANNFRSKYEVIHFNNDFFEYAATQLHPEGQRSYEGLKQNAREDNKGGYVNIEFLDADNANELRELNSEKTLETITNLLAEGYRKKDIAILNRGNKEGSLIARHLLKNNIPVISSDSLMLANSKEVCLLMSFISYLSYTNIKLYKAEIANYLWEIKKIDKNPILNNSSDFNNITKFVRQFGFEINEKQLLENTPYQTTQILIEVFQLHNNLFVNSFCDELWKFTNKQYSSFAEVMEWWNENKTKLSVTTPEGADAVRIMTIHKSKGLEFEVVILPNANYYTQTKGSLMWAEIENEQLKGLSNVLVNNTKLLEETCLQEIHTEELFKTDLDNLNLLYVAYTRAVERLYIITSEPTGTNKTSKSTVDFLTHKNMYEAGKTIYEFGQKTKPIHKGEVIIESTFSELPLFNWKQNITISTKYSKENYNSKIVAGNIFHEIISEINYESDVTFVIEKNADLKLLSPTERNFVESKVHEILLHENTKAFFSEEYKVITEKEILLDGAVILRPDRVLIKDNVAIVVDFKTGKPNNKHIDQIRSYKSALQKLDFKNVKAYLIYTDNFEVKEV